jgi:hypothetical protein
VLETEACPAIFCTVAQVEACLEQFPGPGQAQVLGRQRLDPRPRRLPPVADEPCAARASSASASQG